VISEIDKPGSPAGEAKGNFYNQLFGRDAEHRRAFRERVLNVDMEQLTTAADRYLYKKPHSVAVVTSQRENAAIEALGLSKHQIN